MSVNFTNLSKTFPKDYYPLPNMGKLLDEIEEHQILSYLDTFNKYNQINMNPKDVDKTTFVTELATLSNTVMLFGLKSVEATC